MALTNFIVTLVGVGAIAYMMKTDIRHSSAMFRRNLRHIRSWLEEQGAAAEKASREEIKQVGENLSKSNGNKFEGGSKTSKTE